MICRGRGVHATKEGKVQREEKVRSSRLAHERQDDLKVKLSAAVNLYRSRFLLGRWMDRLVRGDDEAVEHGWAQRLGDLCKRFSRLVSGEEDRRADVLR